MHNQKLARSLKQGCNDHIQELAVITEKLVVSEVKKSSKKSSKKQKKSKIDKVEDEMLAQDETKDKEKETKSAKKR